MTVEASKTRTKYARNFGLHYSTKIRHKPTLKASHPITLSWGSDKIPLVSLRRSLVLLGLVQREAVSSLEHIRRIAGAEDVALLALPLGLVDGVDPVLNLHDDAAVLLDDTRAVGLSTLR